MLTFKGVAHGPAGARRTHAADMSAAEISTTNLGKKVTPVHVEHDRAIAVGQVTSSWRGPKGELRVSGRVTDEDAIKLVKSGQMRGLSLGTAVTSNSDDPNAAALRQHEELSLCAEPRRSGCYINEIDGQVVRTVHAYAKRALFEIECTDLKIRKVANPHTSQMSDTPAVDTAEGFSAEFVASLKKELADKTASEASLRSKFAVYEARQRETLKSLQPAVMEWVNTGMEEAGAEHKAELQPLLEFGNGLAEAANVDSALPLARMISCHSARFKRKTDEFSVASATAEDLAAANKTIDDLKAADAAKAQRITELEALSNERQVVAEKLSEQLSATGAVAEKFDFSRAAAREVNPPAGASDSSAASSAPAAAARSKAPMADPLLAFVSNSGSGSGQLMPSASTHALLGGGTPTFF